MFIDARMERLIMANLQVLLQTLRSSHERLRWRDDNPPRRARTVDWVKHGIEQQILNADVIVEVF